MKTFKTLELAIEFFETVEKAPFQGHLRDQIYRASSSISLNLSEGNAKRSVREKKRFYQMSYASLKECQTLLRLLKNKNSELDERANHLGACLFKLMNAKIEGLNSPARRGARHFLM